MSDDPNEFSKIIEFLTESHLESNGGYPHDYAFVAHHLVIADLNEAKERNQTQLKVYKFSTLRKWLRRARKYAERCGIDFDSLGVEHEMFAECFYETEELERVAS